jgi:Tfp pilus assembly protein PilN
MIRINLIPPEITQKRRTENRLALMILVFILAMAAVGVFGFVIKLQVDNKRSEVATAQQTLEETQQEADRLAVFEQTVSDLQNRQQFADTALEGRVDWARMCEEVSLVLPEDAWLLSINADEEQGVTFVGQVLDYQDDVPDTGHKAIARTLVRLTDLEQLFNVWLASSVKAGPQDEWEESWLDFQITASVQEPVEETAEGDPAPPTDTP